MTVTVIETIDTHTLGEPTRIVRGGFPDLRGKTLAARSRGSLCAGEWIECENLLGLALRGRLREANGRLEPELVGDAHITGEHRFRIDSPDPLAHGFALG